MNNKRLFSVLLVVFALTGACADNAGEPFGPAQRALNEQTASVLTPVTLSEPAVHNIAYTLVWSGGGRVVDTVNGHEIKIMPKTVSEPTWFVMVTLPGDHPVVDLTAWRHVNGVWVQVTNFDSHGVKLRLSYAKTGVKQANRLKVVYLPANNVKGPIEPLTTQIDHSKKQAQAKLSHFSQYSMAMD